jgi:hypothetical protein
MGLGAVRDADLDRFFSTTVRVLTACERVEIFDGYVHS